MSIEKITERIIGDANQEAQQITAEAKNSGNMILQEAREEAKKILQEARRTGEAERRRQIVSRRSVAVIDGNILALRCKQNILEDCFRQAVEKILSSPEYHDFLFREVKSSALTSGEIVLNAKDRKSVGDPLVSRLNKEIPGAAFSLSPETRKIRGGLMIKTENTYVNASIDTALENVRDSITRETAKILFPDQEKGTMTIRTEDEFIFADAYTGCHAARMMKWNDLVRMAGCRDLASLDTLLRDFDYPDSKDIVNGDVELFIRKTQRYLYDQIFTGLPGREDLVVFLYPFDYHNIKVCLKCEFQGKPPDENQLISTGEIDWKVMVAMIRDRNYSRMRPLMQKATAEAIDTFGKTGDPQEIDLILDRACYQDIAKKAEETESAYILELVSAQVDIFNLKNLARAKILNRSWSFFKKIMLPAGSIPERFFLSNYEDSLPQIGDKLPDPNMKEALVEGGQHLEETGDFTLLEKKLHNALMAVTRKAENYTSGIEPVAGYWYAKELEIDNVRIIMNGIVIGLEPEEITDMLRDPWS